MLQPAVQQQHRFAGARLGKMEPQPRCLQESM